MIFHYRATTVQGKERKGSIDATSSDSVINALQKRGLIVLEIKSAEERSWLHMSIFERVTAKEMVILSRQLSTLFEAKVPVLEAFRLLAKQAENPMLGRVLTQVADDVQAGKPISKSLAEHPNVFSDFYVNLVLTGEESGRLSEVFLYLAAYLERQYELTSRAKHAMVYPSFVIAAFVGVMALMFTFIIPRLSEVILSLGTEVPFYTQLIISTSNFFVKYGIFLFILFVLAILFLWRYSKTPKGKIVLDKAKLSIPFVGDLYRKLYLSRIADNLDTMLSSGISMIRAVEITGKVVDSHVYKQILDEAGQFVRGGGSLSEALSTYEEVPSILVQMLKVGEETGKLGFVLGTIAKFYKREVEAAIESLVSLIEPMLIILLGVGVGVLLTSVLLPIYNVASSI